MSAGRVLGRLTVAPVLLLCAWLLATFPLLLFGVFTPPLALIVATPVGALLLTLGLRRVPERLEAPWWVVAALAAIAVAFAVHQGLYVAEQIVVRRDAASYAQFATWIADHGGLPIDQRRELIAGGDPALSYESLAFFQRDHVVWPQFMAGAPLVLAIGQWLGGGYGLILVTPLLGAAGVLVLGGLTARLVGPRWAPLAALVLAVSLPQEWVSRSSYSEPLAQILLLGGLALLVDALDLAPRAARWGALFAGLALGLSVLVRIDGLRDVLPVVAYAGLLAARRRGEALPLFGGLAVGVAYGLADGYLLSRPYLEDIAASFDPLLAGSIAGVVLVAAVTPAMRRWGVPDLSRGPWPWVVAALPVLVTVALAVRPLVQTARGHGLPITAELVGKLQLQEGLPFDPDRTYEEFSLYWTAWYVGIPVIIGATVAAAILAHRSMRGRSPRWLLPLVVITWTVAITLLRPAITPDHPWASRRLAALVIPGLILLAVWAVAYGVRWMRTNGFDRGYLVWATALGASVLLVPTAVTSFGLMFKQTDAGEIAAVRGLCARIPPDASAVIVERVTGDRFTQVVRGMCGVPTARMHAPTPEDVSRVATAIRANGRRPVLLGASEGDLTPYLPPGTRPVHALHLKTRQDAHTLMKPPASTWSMELNVWSAVLSK
ncbi:MAG: hypothetical protein GEV11_13730 [Streptosporangiales bacterium]|nr:hypothetical protein [Streptosporangiales bacterium]